MQCVACVQTFLQNSTIWNEWIDLKLCRLMHLGLGLYLGAHEANTSQLPTVSMRRATTVLEDLSVCANRAYNPYEYCLLLPAFKLFYLLPGLT